MSEHRIELRWAREGAEFTRENYSRSHQIQFPGGQTLRASAAAAYGGDPTHVDPEQQLLAALSSCHMLTFLAVCANRGLVIEDYADQASTTLAKNAEGQTALTLCTLRPKVRFAPQSGPDQAQFAQLHARAHRACFIANSIRSEVQIEAEMLV